MENKEVILTDDELNKVVNTLSENRNETDTLLERIEKEHENDDNSNAPLEEGEGMYVSDGTIIGVDEASTNDFSSFDAIDLDLGKLTEENLTATITEAYDMTEEEALKFVSVISRVRNKEKFAIYNELPQKIKSQILSAAMESGVPQNQMPMYLQSMSKMIIEELVHDTEMDALSIDLEKAMKELIPSPLEMYSETNKEYIENEFPKVAESIKDKDPKKAENLLAMRQGFIDAYTFEPMYNILKNNKILKNIKRAKVIWSRVSNDYLAMASVCKFNLYPLNDVYTSLTELGYTEIESYRIAALFVYVYTDGIKNVRNAEDYNDIYRNSFANYFENNIKNLMMNPELVSDFSKTIKENLSKLNEHIHTVIDARDAELSSKNK